MRDFTLRYLPVSHWVQQEAPEAVNEILEAWLRADYSGEEHDSLRILELTDDAQRDGTS